MLIFATAASTLIFIWSHGGMQVGDCIGRVVVGGGAQWGYPDAQKYGSKKKLFSTYQL
jgi:hypothetical protein